MSDGEVRIEAALATSSSEPLVRTPLILRAPQPDELRVQIVATGICHTDIMTKNESLCAFPIVLGHEGVGIVESMGSGVTGFDVGDHVILSYDYCGECPQCHRGKPSYCDKHGALNFAGVRPDGNRTHKSADSESADVYGSFFQQSSFATYALSHASNTIKVDKTLPLPILAPLACGVQTGAGTVFNTLDVVEGSNIAIFGCGCVGLSAVMAAKVAGAKSIIAIDINRKRLQMAEELGATRGIDPANLPAGVSIAEHVKDMTGGEGCHYSIDTTGVPQVLRQAFDCCRPMGVTAMIAPGVPGTEVSIEMLGLLPGKVLRGVVQGDSVSREFIPKLISLWQRGEFPFDKLVTEFRGIDEVDKAINAMESGDVIKPVVLVDEGYC
ncbi:MAG: NAD(P)-dependent alcohol dehydrogenase [Woeseiaceae bacterium]